MKKIWVCGSSGMLGTYIVKLLPEGHISQKIDITDREAVSDFVRTNKITHIINCAAYTQVDQAEVEQSQAYQINAMGPQNLGISARKYGARLLHFSTDYVFDGKGNFPYKEEHSCCPISAYGMTKWAGEVKLLDELPKGCIIRTSWAFGHPGKNFVETMLRLMKEKEHLRVVFDQIGRPTFCKDLAEVALELLDEEGIYHFANASETSWFAFAKEIQLQASQLNFPLKAKIIEAIPTSEYPTPAKRPAYSTLDTKKIEKALGKAPRIWQVALHEYLKGIK